MATVKLGYGDWVVVCDATKGLVLQNAGDAEIPNLQTRHVYAHADAVTREPGSAASPRAEKTDRQGRTPVNPAGHEDGERRFLTELIQHLSGLLGDADARLVVVAPPRALGMLRDLYPPRLKSALRAEIDKDFVNLPVYEIERRLSG